MSKINHKLTEKPEIDLRKDGYALEWCKFGDKVDVWIGKSGIVNHPPYSMICTAEDIAEAFASDAHCRPAKWVEAWPDKAQERVDQVVATIDSPIKQPADPINHPLHYTHSAIEPINVILAWDLDFCLGNVIKYVARADHKGNKLQDLQKAAFYLNQEIERLKNG